MPCTLEPPFSASACWSATRTPCYQAEVGPRNKLQVYVWLKRYRTPTNHRFWSIFVNLLKDFVLDTIFLSHSHLIYGSPFDLFKRFWYGIAVIAFSFLCVDAYSFYLRAIHIVNIRHFHLEPPMPLIKPKKSRKRQLRRAGSPLCGEAGATTLRGGAQGAGASGGF